MMGLKLLVWHIQGNTLLIDTSMAYCFVGDVAVSEPRGGIHMWWDLDVGGSALKMSWVSCGTPD